MWFNVRVGSRIPRARDRTQSPQPECKVLVLLLLVLDLQVVVAVGAYNCTRRWAARLKLRRRRDSHLGRRVLLEVPGSTRITCGHTVENSMNCRLGRNS
eukprot:2783613-Rhodomonas_salina.1